MSLLVTSCTMGQQPDRLLNKGPQYLRTRTTAGLFAHHRKSAVELLAASKSQFYSGKDPVGLDRQQDLALTPGQSHRYSSSKTHQQRQREPSRSKSEYNLSQILSAESEEDNDHNNNDTSEDSIQLAKIEVLEGTKCLTPHGRSQQVAGSVDSTRKVSPSEDLWGAEGITKNVTRDSGIQSKIVYLACPVEQSYVNSSHGDVCMSIAHDTTNADSISHSKSTVLNNLHNSCLQLNGTNDSVIVSLNANPVQHSEIRATVLPPRNTPAVPPRNTPAVTPRNTSAVSPRNTPAVPPRNKPVVPPRNKPEVPPRNKPAVPPRNKPEIPLKKSRGKPVPPPKNFSLKSLTLTSPRKPDKGRTEILSAEESCAKELATPTGHPGLESHSRNSYKVSKDKYDREASQQTDVITQLTRGKSLVESLTQRFTNLGSPSSPNSPSALEIPQTPVSLIAQDLYHTEKLTPLTQIAVKPGSGNNVITYTATPIFISQSSRSAHSFTAKPVFISEQHESAETISSFHRSLVQLDETPVIKRRTRSPNVPSSNKYSKRERRSSQPDKSSSVVTSSQIIVKLDPGVRSISVSSCQSEMSIQSVDQAACQSGINAIPSTSFSMDEMIGEETGPREVTRTKSSLVSTMESQHFSNLCASAIHHCSSVPRSHSDISCRLESQHSRDSSIVSNHSRLSCASVGTDLENFFNHMGLERGVLEPIARLKELQVHEVFDTMSSLDSRDAASIRSTYSRSEQELSDSQSVDRSQQQTSVVERNARIIKWLCNVRKAKVSQANNTDHEATGKT